jgi:hypothetical protein
MKHVHIFLSTVWNISNVVCQKKLNLMNKTNNSLEHYNHHFNGMCSCIDQNLVSFSKVIHGEGDRVIRGVEDIVKSREDPPDYQEPMFPEIPAALWDM